MTSLQESTIYEEAGTLAGRLPPPPQGHRTVPLSVDSVTQLPTRCCQASRINRGKLTVDRGWLIRLPCQSIVLVYATASRPILMWEVVGHYIY